MAMQAEAALPPGAVIGILGGGQLGRMLALAAARLGFRCHVYCPDPHSPAFDVSAARTVAIYDDADALDAFAGAVDVVTYEFENVDVAAVERLEAVVPVRPSRRALAVSQDRLLEKSFLRDLGIATARVEQVDSADDLEAARAVLGAPAILKTRRFGYDGKGQTLVSGNDDAQGAYARIGNASAILEERVAFARETSIIGVRGIAGERTCYDVAENVHRSGILHTSTVPAAIGETLAAEARSIAEKILTSLDYVGAIAIELFHVADEGAERLLVNELAPRVHNSGHWTEDACAVSQFENHIRAVAGWPLGPTARHADAVMTNLIGDDIARWPEIAGDPAARLHLYGKRESRPGRKMGHVNRIFPRKR